ncbi:hypothetical protein PC2016_3780 [Pseudoalteromonas carrageenovora]|uniref:Uncharacterized protein n=1 Tax=Pseudoalteromonas carrageenovora IAM 12662 TaxID=1314868 RepID=A0A2K4XE62_PSEVC|nr:hypothetical protein [Pseudoalteromonas carrageenovora]MBE0384198.1 hypothetical protein [Pseudoalteromonas carrageenovora IAM 12662]QBJ73948.1 hypothetical protein PC2016_3780 [Pseudoalteromonas carrageenovora]GEB73180.1 hypothetical protein PCA01_38900 [Pseudoalteromonas carrageenovora]SOU42591.1 conserved protein of unknown function [Pseudoalteromonas carrageenovora IAM 12662]
MALEIRICLDAVTAEVVKCKTDKEDTFSKDNNHIKSDVITSGTPYIWRKEYSQFSDNPTSEQKNILRQFSLLPAQSKRNIAGMLRDFGSETLLAISDFQAQVIPFLESNTHAIVGSGATSIEARSSKFVDLAIKYEASLKDIRAAHKSGMPKYHMVALEQKALAIFKDLQVKYQAELQRFMNTNRASRRGTVWSNPDRGVHIAKSARHSSKLDISSTAELNKIKRLENNARWLGYGMIAVDAVVRGVSVYSDYKNGGNLQRSISTELASFGAATATGIYVGTVTTTALSSLLMLTPYGWVIALGVGLYVGFAASNEMSKFMKQTSENIYDRKPIFEGVF